jgi:tRNA(Ile2) C34 agmatinyltransferase TiaS
MTFGEINTNYETHYIPITSEKIIVNIAVIYRKKNSLSTHKCPFCNKTHSHGSLPGHRVPHCSTNKKSLKIELENGVVLDSQNGYYVKNY